MKKNWVIVLCVGVIVSCKPSTKNTIVPYMDTKLLFEKAIKQLNTEHKILNKTLVFGDSVAIQNVKDVDWETELRPFTEVDLRKNTYKGRFNIKLERDDEHYISLKYIATDGKTDLKELSVTVTKPDSMLVELKAIFTEQNTLYSATKNMIYYADSLFTINGSQQAKLGNEVTYSVTGKINAGQ